MKKIIIIASLIAPYSSWSAIPSNFEFDIPQQTKDNVGDQAPHKGRIKVTIPVAAPILNTTLAAPALPAGAPQTLTKPVAKMVQKPDLVKQAVMPAAKPGKNVLVAKETYRVEQVAKAPAVPGKLCVPTTIAMTFQNLPTQKGPYLNRWVSLGCNADEVNFVREGNEQYSMNWTLSYVPADAQETARYALRWKIKGNDDKGAPLDYEASHTFNLDSARTLSLTNNMAVTLRKVP